MIVELLDRLNEVSGASWGCPLRPAPAIRSSIPAFADSFIPSFVRSSVRSLARSFVRPATLTPRSLLPAPTACRCDVQPLLPSILSPADATSLLERCAPALAGGPPSPFPLFAARLLIVPLVFSSPSPCAAAHAVRNRMVAHLPAPQPSCLLELLFSCARHLQCLSVTRVLGVHMLHMLCAQRRRQRRAHAGQDVPCGAFFLGRHARGEFWKGGRGHGTAAEQVYEPWCHWFFFVSFWLTKISRRVRLVGE